MHARLSQACRSCRGHPAGQGDQHAGMVVVLLDALGKKMKGQEYVRPMPATWWLHNTHLTLFMIRELTSLFVAGYAVFLLVLVAMAKDPAAFAAALHSAAAIVFQLIALPFVIFHSVTWFNLTPKAIVLFRG